MNYAKAIKLLYCVETPGVVQMFGGNTNKVERDPERMTRPKFKFEPPTCVQGEEGLGSTGGNTIPVSRTENSSVALQSSRASQRQLCATYCSPPVSVTCQRLVLETNSSWTRAY
jgi:hypothetical protein